MVPGTVVITELSEFASTVVTPGVAKPASGVNDTEVVVLKVPLPEIL